MIERHCTLTRTPSKNRILRLDDATVYYNFPTSENIIQTCQTPTIIKLQGQGIFEIPTGCSIATRLETFVNLSPPSVYRHQLNRIIPPLTLTDPEHANTFWNNARDEIGIVALSSIASTILSLILTQCITALSIAGAHKLRQHRKQLKKSKTENKEEQEEPIQEETEPEIHPVPTPMPTPLPLLSLSRFRLPLMYKRPPPPPPSDSDEIVDNFVQPTYANENRTQF
jgi:hypothetical protein